MKQLPFILVYDMCSDTSEEILPVETMTSLLADSKIDFKTGGQDLSFLHVRAHNVGGRETARKPLKNGLIRSVLLVESNRYWMTNPCTRKTRKTSAFFISTGTSALFVCCTAVVDNS